ncbi:MAG: response regulator [Bacteroidota bacterium]|nr:response regulator [Bacteroidota bacterium]
MIRSILLVEDDLLDQTMFKLSFKNQEPAVSIACACNGLEAIQFLKNTIPDIIFLDQNMPEMNGLEFLKIIKSDKLLCQIPVVVFTPSLYLNKHNEDLLSQGAYGYVLKDLSMTGPGSVKGIIKQINKQSAA